MDWSHPFLSVITLGILTFTLCWPYGLWRRSNSLRLMTVAVGVLVAAATFWLLPRVHGSTQLTFFWLQSAAFVTTAGLLVLPASHAWYVPRAPA
jgi:hypothetical protein